MFQQIQKHAPKTYKKLLQKGLVQQGANPLVAVKGKGGSPYQEYEDPYVHLDDPRMRYLQYTVMLP